MSRASSFVLGLVAAIMALGLGPALGAGPSPFPTGPAASQSPLPAIELRLLDAASVFSADQHDQLADRIRNLWLNDGIDVLVATRVAPSRTSVADTETDATNIGNNANVGVGARGGLVVLFNLDASKCHGQAQIYADDRLRAVVPNEDRQAVFDRLMVPELKNCDLFAAANAGIDATIKLAHGDRSSLPAPVSIDWLFWILVITGGLLGLFLLALIIGRIAAFPDARRRHDEMMQRYRQGVENPAIPTDDDDDFIYGGGRKRRHRRRGSDVINGGNPDWNDPLDYPVYYGRPPGFWPWWFGVGSHTTSPVTAGSASGGGWSSSGRGNSSGGSWATGLASGGFWSGIGHDAGSVFGGVGEVLDGLAEGSGGSGGGFSGGGGAGGGF